MHVKIPKERKKEMFYFIYGDMGSYIIMVKDNSDSPQRGNPLPLHELLLD